MIAILTIFAAVGWFAVFFLLALIGRRRRTKWRIELPPEDVDRGPNADDSYRAVWVGGHNHWFTREQVIDANERALKYKR